MADHESPNIEAAAHLAREVDPGNGPDRYAERLEAEREATLERKAWTPGRGRDEAAGW